MEGESPTINFVTLTMRLTLTQTRRNSWSNAREKFAIRRIRCMSTSSGRMVENPVRKFGLKHWKALHLRICLRLAGVKPKYCSTLEFRSGMFSKGSVNVKLSRKIYLRLRSRFPWHIPVIIWAVLDLMLRGIKLFYVASGLFGAFTALGI